MISHNHKCIFIHIPKCAGSSIESALGHFDGHHGRGGQDHRSIRTIEKPVLTICTFSSKENIKEYLRRVKYYNYKKVANKKNKTTVTKEQYEKYFKFAVVRNPWDRAFSWYKNVMRDKIHKKNQGITSDLTFNQFLKVNIGKGMLRPQTYWLKNYKGLIPLDYIGKFETLQDTFTKIKERLNLPEIEFPHKKKGSGEDYRSMYDEESIAHVKNIYHEDIQLFGYTFRS